MQGETVCKMNYLGKYIKKNIIWENLSLGQDPIWEMIQMVLSVWKRILLPVVQHRVPPGACDLVYPAGVKALHPQCTVDPASKERKRILNEIFLFVIYIVK